LRIIAGSPERRLTSAYDLENQVGIVDTRFKFPGSCPVYCHKVSRFPFTYRQDQKTLLAVTNVPVEPVPLF